MVVVYVFCVFKFFLANSVIIYRKFMIIHKQKPMNHYVFNKAVALAWICQDTHWPTNLDDQERIDLRKARIVSTEESTTILSCTRRSLCLKATMPSLTKNSSRVTDSCLTSNEALRIRLQRGEHWPVQDKTQKGTKMLVVLLGNKRKTSCPTYELYCTVFLTQI